MKPTAIKTVRSYTTGVDSGVDINLPDSDIYISKTSLVLLAQFGASESYGLALYKLDGTTPTGITFSLAMPPKATIDIIITESVLEDSSLGLELAFTPTDIYNAKGLLSIRYLNTLGSYSIFSVIVEAKVSFTSMQLSTNQTVLDFGELAIQEEASLDVTINYAGFDPDVANLTYSSESADPLIFFKPSFVEKTATTLTVTIVSKLYYSGNFSGNLTLYYNDMPISGFPIDITAANSGNTAEPTFDPYVPPIFTSPEGDSYYYHLVSSSDGLLFRVLSYSFMNDPLEEYTLAYPEAVTSMILVSNQVSSIKVMYTPKKATREDPLLVLNGYFFTN